MTTLFSNRLKTTIMETNSGIVLRKTNSANVRLDNSGDTERVYDVAADTDISENTAGSFNGEVMRDGFQIAGFSCYGPSDDNLSINYQNVPASQQCAVLTAVQGFLAASRSFVGASPSLTGI